MARFLLLAFTLLLIAGCDTSSTNSSDTLDDASFRATLSGERSAVLEGQAHTLDEFDQGQFGSVLVPLDDDREVVFLALRLSSEHESGTDELNFLYVGDEAPQPATYPVDGIVTVGGLRDKQFLAFYQRRTADTIETYGLSDNNNEHRIEVLNDDAMEGTFTLSFPRKVVYDRAAYEAALEAISRGEEIEFPEAIRITLDEPLQIAGSYRASPL